MRAHAFVRAVAGGRREKCQKIYATGSTGRGAEAEAEAMLRKVSLSRYVAHRQRATAARQNPDISITSSRSVSETNHLVSL